MEFGQEETQRVACFILKYSVGSGCVGIAQTPRNLIKLNAATFS